MMAGIIFEDYPMPICVPACKVRLNYAICPMTAKSRARK